MGWHSIFFLKLFPLYSLLQNKGWFYGISRSARGKSLLLCQVSQLKTCCLHEMISCPGLFLSSSITDVEAAWQTVKRPAAENLKADTMNHGLECMESLHCESVREEN